MYFEYFLYNENNIKNKVKFSKIRFIKSIFKYLKIITIYRKKEFGYCKNLIQECYVDNKYKIENNLKLYTEDEFLFCAARLIPFYRLFGKLVSQSDLCLERSVALAYSLIYLGFPSYIIIGKCNYYMTEFVFHSWVEISGRPLNDHIGVKKQWTAIYKFPKIPIK